MHCTNCGCELKEGAAVCPDCGEAVVSSTVPAETTTEENDQSLVAANTEPAEITAEPTCDTDENPLTGWSDKLDAPEIKKAAAKQKKSAQVFGIIFGILFPVGFIVAGLLIKSIPMKLALIVGFGLGLFMVALAFFRMLSLNKPIWEGTVADKTAVEHYDKKNSEKATTVYTVVFHGIGGGKKKLKIKDNSEFYDYFKVGDKVRYYPVFGTFEKRDKSHDSIIFCNVCSTKNPIENKKCSRCKSPLFK